MIESQQHSLTAMTNLLNSLLDISRLDAGAVTPELEEFPIRRLVDRLSDEFARQAQHKGLEFSSSSSDGFIRSDPNLLAEITTLQQRYAEISLPVESLHGTADTTGKSTAAPDGSDSWTSSA